MSFRGLAVAPPLAPMEAKSVDQIPTGPEWQYEPKWDGFRCLVFRNNETVELQSKTGQPMARYFPELVAAILALDAKKLVIDGEIIILVAGKLSFDDLLQRIHPAASRIKKLSESHPAHFVAFDLLVDDSGKSLLEEPLSKRRAALEKFFNEYFAGREKLSLSPTTTDVRSARQWLTTLKGQLDGIVAKKLDLPYLSGERAMRKIKNLRTADCVVGGFRYLAKEALVGSLLLGLYDDDGLLHHVGFTSSIAASERRALTAKLTLLVEPPGFTGRAPGGPSRWSSERSSEWQPLRPELVAEVQYDHFSGHRFRHGTKFLRWRPDKAPEQCLLNQVAKRTKSPASLLEIKSEKK